MKLLHIAAGAMLLLSSSVNSFAGSVRLDYYSATGFATGPLAGQPVHFVVTMDGNTGTLRVSWLENFYVAFMGVDTTASLTVGGTQILSSVVSSDFVGGRGEGLDALGSTIAGVQFELVTSLGDLFRFPHSWQFPPDIRDVPSQIDQILQVGNILLNPVEPRFVQSTIVYDGQIAVLTSLYVSPVPLPATLPLFAGGLGLIGFLGWRGKRKVAS